MSVLKKDWSTLHADDALQERVHHAQPDTGAAEQAWAHLKASRCRAARRRRSRELPPEPGACPFMEDACADDSNRCLKASGEVPLPSSAISLSLQHCTERR